MKFKMTSACQTIRITSLKTDSSYPIERAENVQTRYGEAVLLTLKESSQMYVKVFLPRRYGALFSVDDLKSINEKTVSRSQIPRHLLHIKSIHFRDRIVVM